MLGASAASNAAFSTCSEKARAEQIRGRENRETYKAKQKGAANTALLTAAKNKKINDTVKAMENLDGCTFRQSSTLDDAKCFAAV